MEGFRTFVKGWFGKLLLAALMIPFALFGAFEFMGQSGDAAAVVGKSRITQQALQQQIAETRKQLLADNANITLDENKLAAQVLDQMVDRKLILHQAQQLGLVVTDQQVEDAIRAMPVFQDDNGQYSPARFADVLRQNRLNREQVYQDIRVENLSRQLITLVSQSAVTAPQEMQRLLAFQTQQRTAIIGLVPTPPLQTIPPASAAAIQAYYRQHQGTLVQPATVKLSYLILDQAALAGQVQITEADIQAVYQRQLAAAQGNEERQVQHILIAVDDKTTEAQAQQQIGQLAARVAKGEDFAALARQYSKDPGSAGQGGTLDFITRGAGFDPAFDQAAFALSQVGQVSAPVKSAAGYHLIRLLDIRQAGQMGSMESLRPELEAQARQDKMTAVYNEKINQLNDLAGGSGNLLEVAKAGGLAIRNAGRISALQLPAELDQPAVAVAIFNANTIQQGQISTGLPLTPTQTVWVQATDYQPAAPMTLAQATPLIQQRLQIQTQVAAGRKLAEQVIAQVRAGTPLAAAASKAGMALQPAITLSRLQPLPQADLQRQLFAMPAPVNGNPVLSVAVDSDQVYLVALQGVTSGSGVPEPMQQQLAETLRQQQAQSDLMDYVAYLRGTVKTKRNAVVAPPAN